MGLKLFGKWTELTIENRPLQKYSECDTRTLGNGKILFLFKLPMGSSLSCLRGSEAKEYLTDVTRSLSLELTLEHGVASEGEDLESGDTAEDEHLEDEEVLLKNAVFKDDVEAFNDDSPEDALDILSVTTTEDTDSEFDEEPIISDHDIHYSEMLNGTTKVSPDNLTAELTYA